MLPWFISCASKDINRWQINFDLEAAPATTSVATFTIQLAGATTTAGNTGIPQGAYPSFAVGLKVIEWIIGLWLLSDFNICQRWIGSSQFRDWVLPERQLCCTFRYVAGNVCRNLSPQTHIGRNILLSVDSKIRVSWYLAERGTQPTSGKLCKITCYIVCLTQTLPTAGVALCRGWYCKFGCSRSDQWFQHRHLYSTCNMTPYDWSFRRSSKYFQLCTRDKQCSINKW